MSTISRMRGWWWWIRSWHRQWQRCWCGGHSRSTNKSPYRYYLKCLMILYMMTVCLLILLYCWSNRRVDPIISDGGGSRSGIEPAPPPSTLLNRQHNSRDSDTHRSRSNGRQHSQPPQPQQPMKAFLNSLKKSLNFFGSASTQKQFTYSLVNRQGKQISIEAVLPIRPGSASLEERVVLHLPTRINKQRLLLMWDVSFRQENLRGCSDWNCKVTSDQSLLKEADAVFFSSSDFRENHTSPSQYFIHYSQESPIYSMHYGNVKTDRPAFFNMSLSYRFDTPSASPYGYTAKLAKESRRGTNYMKQIEKVVAGKSKAISWFVSHCPTSSQREQIINILKSLMHIDIYGFCGPLKCAKRSECEEALNKEYYFYFAAENSICKDYITEKGFSHLVVPIVLRRWVVEPYAPPHSFIAVDDYPNIKALAAHLNALMNNKSKYMEYFNWKRDYEVIVLDDKTHPTAERAWGFCQMTQMEPRPTAIIENMAKFWDGSCEVEGEFIDKFFGVHRPKAPRPGAERTVKMLRTLNTKGGAIIY